MREAGVCVRGVEGSQGLLQRLLRCCVTNTAGDDRIQCEGAGSYQARVAALSKSGGAKACERPVCW